MFETLLILTALPFIIPFMLMCFCVALFTVCAGMAYGILSFFRPLFE